jgi:hypothetical protein
MAKNRNKKKRNAAVSMDITEETVSDLPQGTASSAEENEGKIVFEFSICCFFIFDFYSACVL